MTNANAGTSNTGPAPDRPIVADGALPNERRNRSIPVATDRRKPLDAAGQRASNAAEKRRTSERRRLIDPTTCERDYSDDETEFMKCMDRYKRENRRPFPTWSEVLEVLRSLGYRRVAETTALPGGKRDAKAAAAIAAQDRLDHNLERELSDEDND